MFFVPSPLEVRKSLLSLVFTSWVPCVMLEGNLVSDVMEKMTTKRDKAS